MPSRRFHGARHHGAGLQTRYQEQSQQTEHRHDQNGFPVPGRKFGYPFAALGRQLRYPETVLCGGGCTLRGGLSGLPCSFGILLFDTPFLHIREMGLLAACAICGLSRKDFW